MAKFGRGCALFATGLSVPGERQGVLVLIRFQAGDALGSNGSAKRGLPSSRRLACQEPLGCGSPVLRARQQRHSASSGFPAPEPLTRAGILRLPAGQRTDFPYLLHPAATRRDRLHPPTTSARRSSDFFYAGGVTGLGDRFPGPGTRVWSGGWIRLALFSNSAAGSSPQCQEDADRPARSMAKRQVRNTNARHVQRIQRKQQKQAWAS